MKTSNLRLPAPLIGWLPLCSSPAEAQRHQWHHGCFFIMSRLARLCFCLIIGMGLCFSLHAQTDDPNKVDDDGDGLIEIWSLTDLNNMRHDLAGSSYKNASGATGDTTGCPDKDHDEDVNTPQQPTCHGYELMQDLDFTDRQATGYQAAWTEDPGWTPIGSSSAPFTGTLEGNGYEIGNLYMNISKTARLSTVHEGFFGYVGPGGVVRNVGLTGRDMFVEISTKGPLARVYFGGLVGYARGAAITNCYSTGNVTGSTESGAVSIGGLVGAAAETTLRNCYTTGHATGRADNPASVGGLVGGSGGGLNLLNCYTTGNVRASANAFSHAGGLVGASEATKSLGISNCYATGSVTATSVGRDRSIVGGMVGDRYTNAENSYHSGRLSGDIKSTAGTPKTRDELRALTKMTPGWDEKNWYFSGGEDYPVLRKYEEDENGNQVKGKVLRNQPIEEPTTPTTPPPPTNTSENQEPPASDPIFGGAPKTPVRIHPNPTFGLLRLPMMSTGTAKVFGPNGAEVGSFAVSAGRTDLSVLRAGVYIVRLSDGSVFRVVKN